MTDETPRHQRAAGERPPRRAFPPFSALRALDAVARLGGVRKAAEALSVEHSTVSRHLRTLEEWTGAKLIASTGRGVTLTEEGWRYHEQIALGLRTIASATLDLMHQRDHKRLGIRSVPAFAFQWLVPRLDRFRDANPDLAIEVRPTEIHSDIGSHDADVDIRHIPPFCERAKPPSHVRSQELARVPIFPVASVDYLARSPQIREPADLLGHVLIQEDSPDVWRGWFMKHNIPGVSRLEGPRLWHGHLAMEAARRGQGIALADHFLACDDLASGRLVEVIGIAGSFGREILCSYDMAIRADRWNAPGVVSFRRWLVSLVEAEATPRANT